MSQENVEVVRASINAYNVGDMDALMATYSPRVVANFHATAESRLPDLEERLTGREAVGRFLTETLQSWRFRFDPAELTAVGADAVMCRGPLGGVGMATGIGLDQEASVVFRLRYGLIEQIDFYEAPSEALKAVGLEE